MTSVCKECTCTILSYLLPKSDLTTACLQDPQLAALFVNHEHCQQGWVWAASLSKCVRAFSYLKSWAHASAFCKSGGGSLAQPKDNSSFYIMIETINLQQEAKGEFWIGGRRNEDTDGYIWDLDNSTVNADNWAPGYPLPGINNCLKYVQNLVPGFLFVKLRQGSGKDRQGMALKAKGIKA